LKAKDQYPLIYLDWCDAMANISSWTTEDDAIEWAENGEGLVKQVGWLIKETKNYLLIADRLGHINSGSTDLGGVFKIPTRWVKKRETISLSFPLS